MFHPAVVNSQHKVSLLHDKHGFMVKEKDALKRVKSYDTDKLLRTMSPKEIAAYTQMGKFRVNKFNNGEYSVTAQGGLNGGGPIAGFLGYWGVKIVGQVVGMLVTRKAIENITGGSPSTNLGSGLQLAGRYSMAGSSQVSPVNPENLNPGSFYRMNSNAFNIGAGVAAEIMADRGHTDNAADLAIAIGTTALGYTGFFEAAATATGAALGACPLLP